MVVKMSLGVLFVHVFSHFLPQDKVCEFAQLTPEKLLRETERAVGDMDMLLQHEKLIDLKASHKNDLNVCKIFINALWN